MPIYKNLVLPLLFTLLVVFSSVIMNLSLRFMGFDFGENLFSYVTGDMINLLFEIYGKIIIIQFIYFATILQILEILSEKLSNIKIYTYTILIFLFVPFIAAIGRYPQLYGDFFYLQYPSLKFILNIITQFTNPFFFECAIYAILFIILFYLIIQIFINKTSYYLITSCFLILFTVFHLKGEWIGLVINYVVWKILIHKKYEIKILYGVSILFLFLLFGFFWYYNENYFFKTHSDSKNPSIFLISADSLRKDKIGYSRNGKSITPNIDKFSKESFSFQDHNTTIPRTFPAWADLLTGKYSMDHKIRDMFPAPEEAERIGSLHYPTLGLILSKEKEYETSVFSNFAGDIFPRANFGYKVVQTPDFNANIILIQKALETQIFLLPILSGVLSGGEYFPEIKSFSNLGDGRFILRDWKYYLRQNADKNLFSTLFFSVIHFPYSPPFPYYNLYSKNEYDGNYKFIKFVDPTNDKKPSLEDIEQIRALYDESVTAFDDSFGEIIEELKKIGKYDSSIIILTGDHGESLYEDVHGHGHGEHLRGEAVLGIPLIIKFPDDYTKKINSECKIESCSTFRGITSSIDIFPTLLEYLNIKLPGEYPGKSLLSILGKENWEKERYIYAETGIWFSDLGDHFFQKQRIMYPNILKLHRIIPEKNNQIMITDPFYRNTIAFSKHRAILSSNYKFIYIPTHDGVNYELYDRVNDPLNTKNLVPNQIMEFYRRELYDISKKWENGKVISEYIFPPPIE